MPLERAVRIRTGETRHGRSSERPDAIRSFEQSEEFFRMMPSNPDPRAAAATRRRLVVPTTAAVAQDAAAPEAAEAVEYALAGDTASSSTRC